MIIVNLRSSEFLIIVIIVNPLFDFAYTESEEQTHRFVFASFRDSKLRKHLRERILSSNNNRAARWCISISRGNTSIRDKVRALTAVVE